MQRRAAMGVSMILVQNIIQHVYFVLSALVAVLLVSRLFRRKTRPGLAYDIVYAYAIIPFILRALHIK
jgi:mannose/fructose/N-acetylgalactosamine-specific phosphotransferase system component IID